MCHVAFLIDLINSMYVYTGQWLSGFCEYGLDPEVESHYYIYSLQTGEDSDCGLACKTV